MILQTESPWSSLEIAKLAVSALTPVLILGLGLLVHRFTKRLELLQWRNEKLIEKRLSIYDDIAPLLNDLLCYYTYIGSWKSFTPQQIVEYKRTLEKKIYLAAPMFPHAFFESCTHFMDLCYQTYTGWGEDAKLRTSFQRRKEAAGSKWDKKWEACFAAEATEAAEIRQAYHHLMNTFSKEVGLSDRPDSPVTGRIPSNVG